MSYDLWLLPKDGRELSRKEFRAFFKERQWYTLEDGQATYMNEDTGVYFVFDYRKKPEDEDEQDELPYPHVFFNLNFFRPHTFGLEAEIELTAFARHFGLTVSDPQTEGMGDGEYSSEGFLRGWNSGNAFAYCSILSQDEPGDTWYSLPGAVLEGYWRWSLHREEFYENLKLDLFVPTINYFLMNGKVVSAVVWGDAIPIALPRVDYVILVTQDLAKRDGRALRKGKPVLSLVEWDMVAHLVSGYPLKSSPVEHRLLFYDPSPKEIVDFFLSQPAFDKSLISAMPADQILTAELVKEAREMTLR